MVGVVKLRKVNDLLTTLVSRCQGALTIPAVHHSLPTLPWRGIEGGVPLSLSSSQGLQGRAAAPQRTLVALDRQATGCAAGLAANH